MEIYIKYYVLNKYIAYSNCTREQSVIFVCVKDFVLARDPKSRYFPPSSLVISHLGSCRDNPQTG